MSRFIIIITIFLYGCVGGLKPSILTMPPSYLSSFPLNTITEEEMMFKSGPPDKNIKIGDKKAMVYQMGEHLGKRTYTYILDNDLIIDVLYNDDGPYNGSTARKIQGSH